MSSPDTKGQMEAQIATAITQFEREHLGRGPQEVRTWIMQDLVLVRLKGVLTPAEEKLARDPERRRLVKDVRRQLLEGSRSVPQLQRLVEQALEERTILVEAHLDVASRSVLGFFQLE